MEEKFWKSIVENRAKEIDKIILKDIITIYISSFSYKEYLDAVVEYNKLAYEKNQEQMKFDPKEKDYKPKICYFYERPIFTKEQFDYIRSLKEE